MLKFIPFAFVLLTTCASFSRSERVKMEEMWGTEIAAFDQLNEGVQPEQAILFYGSSSIRLWENIGADMAPFPVLRRGYGGASMDDAAYFARRVLTPVDYQALVLFVGNDIWGNKYDKTPAEMVIFADQIVRTSRRHEKNAPVFLIEVTHVPARAHLMKEWDAANARLKSYADEHDFVHFITTRDLYVTEDGQIRSELFRSDKIHQNEAGYAIWKERIKQEIGKVLPELGKQERI